MPTLVFGKLDYQEKSTQLTTFITPVERFSFNCLPSGITYAFEYYQKQMSLILSRFLGMVCMIDDNRF